MTKIDRNFGPKVRANVRRRTGGWCQFPDCVRQGVAFHHRLTRSKGGIGNEENCMLLCNDHHLYVHAHPAESYENGWLIRSGLADAG